MSAEVVEVYADGACRGNPGPAAVGVVIFRQGEKIKQVAKAIGEATMLVSSAAANSKAPKGCFRRRAAWASKRPTRTSVLISVPPLTFVAPPYEVVEHRHGDAAGIQMR